MGEVTAIKNIVFDGGSESLTKEQFELILTHLGEKHKGKPHVIGVLRAVWKSKDRNPLVAMDYLAKIFLYEETGIIPDLISPVESPIKNLLTRRKL